MKIGILLFKILSIVYVLSFIIVIIKLITKRYDLFYYEPRGRRFSHISDSSASYIVQGSDKSGFGISSARAENSSVTTVNRSEPSLIDNNDGNSDMNSMFNNSHDIRDGKPKEEESDLTKFFN